MLPTSTLSSVPHMNHPISHVPHYVFENCNQATCNTYDPRYLTILRSQVPGYTKDRVWTMCKKDKEKYVKRSEEFDWIYGLDCLERELLSLGEGNIERALTVDSIMRFNGLFSRLTLHHAPGEFRKKDIRWAKGEKSELELLAAFIFEGYVSTDRPEGFLASRSRPEERKNDTYLVKKSWITKLIRYEKEHYRKDFALQGSEEDENTRKVIEYLSKTSLEEISATIDTWIEAQGHKNGKLDLIQWLEDNFHYFPAAKTIPDELKETLNAIQNSDMHPIEKACRIWFDIVRVHISHEANKRTGKALASIILLSYGYLPPKIGKENTDEYLSCMIDGLESKEGVQNLVDFVARKITETHEEYADSLESSLAKSASTV